MKKTGNRAIATLLVCLQIVLLFTFALPQAKAENGRASQSAEPPVLNETISGTVQFSSFYYPGGNTKTGKEGADYVMPFVYTDDYFAKPSYDASASREKEQNWNKLEDKSLAAASLDFALSCFGTNENKLSQNYSDYAKNGLHYLEKCKFSSNVLVNDQFCAFPTTDSIGVIIGSKDIRVWNRSEQKNESYKLIAVGIRGGGYGAEWASNLTLGASGVHDGFRYAANTVKRALKDYRNSLNLSADAKVKYWIVGYSRSGAVANLVAGDISQNTSDYQTTLEDVYGYTFESAAGASMVSSGSEPVDAESTTIYPNLHNIINKMDAVPRVSIREFNHNRLGVDYILPYYGNTPDDGELNEAYYNRMYSILKTISLGYYNDDNVIEPDPGTVNANPDTYPVNGTIQVQKFDFNQLLVDAKNFGVTPYTGRWGNQKSGTDIGKINPSDGKYYMQLDIYLDKLVQMMFGSKAWDYEPSKLNAGWENLSIVRTYTYGNNEAITNAGFTAHRTKYATKQNGQAMSYQNAMRHLIGKVFETPGAKLTDMFDGITDNLIEKLVPAATLWAAIEGPFGDGYDDSPDENHVAVVDSHFRDLLMRVLADMDAFKSTSSQYTYSPAGATRFRPNRTYNVNQTTGDAVASLCPVFTRLFLYDRNNYGSQYLGTLIKYAASAVLVMHDPEITTSWLKSLDENYTSDYRKITLPLNTDVKMYEFRGAYFNNENLDFDANANVVAEFKNGEMVSSLDGRIEWETGSDTITIWYPGNLDIRFDVKALAPVTVRSANANLSDYEPAVDSNNVQGTNLKVVDYTSSRKPNGNVPDQVDLTRNLKAQANNVPTAVNVNDFLISSSIPLQTGETLQILAEGGSNSLDGSSDAVYTIRKSAIKIADFGTSQTVATNVLEKGTMTGEGGSFAVNGSNELTFTPSVSGTDYSAFSSLTGTTYRFVGDSKRITAQSRVDVIPATNIYYDDPAQGVVTDPEKTTTLVSTIVDGRVDQTTTRDIKFYGTGIDAYCICDSSAGYVKAELLNADGSPVEGVRAMVMNNYYTGTLYNVPTIHFDVPDGAAGTYILRLTASFGKSYKLDGVRVFNESHEDPVEAKLAQVDEGEATYVNVRDILLGKDAASALTDLAYTEGAVYFTGDAERQSPADYETIGPKRELYLTQSGQGIAFNISSPDEVNIAIGLRAADNNAAGVKINGQPKDVTSFDTYYSVTPIDGNVSIEHDSGMVAVTYIKITAKTEVVESGSMLTEAVGPQRIRANAKLLSFVNAPISDPEESPAVEPSETPDPTPAIPELIKQLLSRFVSQLFDSISRLFGGW